jgi:hypothetical protein
MILSITKQKKAARYRPQPVFASCGASSQHQKGGDPILLCVSNAGCPAFVPTEYPISPHSVYGSAAPNIQRPTAPAGAHVSNGGPDGPDDLLDLGDKRAR